MKAGSVVGRAISTLAFGVESGSLARRFPPREMMICRYQRDLWRSGALIGRGGAAAEMRAAAGFRR